MMKYPEAKPLAAHRHLKSIFRLPLRSYLLALIATLAIPLPDSVLADSTRQYWTVAEFSKTYPQMQASSEAFSEQVRKPATASDTPPPVRISVVYPGEQASDYWRRSVSSFEARLKELGMDYNISNFFSKPGEQIRRQSEQIASALASEPDYLVFTLDAVKHQLMIEKLIARKSPKLILQNITTPLQKWRDRQPFLYVGFDHVIGTEILAKEYLRKFDKKARFAIFYGPRGYVSQMRGTTFKEIMVTHDGMELIDEYYTGFDRDTARRAAEQLLGEQPDLDFIYACSTDIALGILDAKKALNNQTVITNGWGGGSAELEAIASKELDMTVMRMNDDNGVAMAEAIKNDLLGQATPTVYSGDMRLVDQSLDAKTVQSYKDWAFRYSE